MTDTYTSEAYAKKLAAKSSFWGTKIAHNMDHVVIFDRKALEKLH